MVSYKMIWGEDGQIASNFLCNALGETGFVCHLGIELTRQNATFSLHIFLCFLKNVRFISN